MKSVSHKVLGIYLARRYMQGLPKRHLNAFILGCIEPDKNPTTYIKGSIKYQVLRGHNWNNTKRYIRRIANRLDRKQMFNLIDFYYLGKLLHYTCDAFTYAHNSQFCNNLKSHRHYEVHLHNSLCQYIQTHSLLLHKQPVSVSELIYREHSRYMRETKSISTDIQYILYVSSLVLEQMDTQLHKPSKKPKKHLANQISS